MSIRFLLLILFHHTIASDTMQLPIYNGKVLELDSNLFCSRRLGLSILPTSDFAIRSCSDGKVHKIWKMDSNEGYEVMIASGDTFYSYSMIDSIKVKVGETVFKGELIGNKRGINNNDSYIIFSVFKKEKELNEAYLLSFH